MAALGVGDACWGASFRRSDSSVLDLERGWCVSPAVPGVRGLFPRAPGTVADPACCVKKSLPAPGVFILVRGLSLVSLQGTYEPGKRHWLKVKKDYLNEGAMADTADLVVLGAFYGQGSKGQGGPWPLGCYFSERRP